MKGPAILSHSDPYNTLAVMGLRCVSQIATPFSLHLVPKHAQNTAFGHQLCRPKRHHLQQHNKALGPRHTVRMSSAMARGTVLLTSAATILTSKVPAWAWVPSSLIAALVGASVIHALQGGVRGYLGLSQEDVLGVPVEKATAEDVAALGESTVYSLAHSAVVVVVMFFSE